jgi:hypothetical protein
MYNLPQIRYINLRKDKILYIEYTYDNMYIFKNIYRYYEGE